MYVSVFPYILANPMLPSRVVCLLSAFILFTGTSVVAQRQGYTFARADNGLISVSVEHSSGQYRIDTPGNLPLLFQGKDGLTAYTNVRVDGVVYTTNVLQRLEAPAGTTRLPIREVEELSDRVRVRGMLYRGKDSLGITLDFIPSVDGDYAYVRIETRVRNFGSRPLRVGGLHLLDLMLGNADLVDVLMPDPQPRAEFARSGGGIPMSYDGVVAGVPTRLRGRLRGLGGPDPDDIVFGQWQYGGYLGTVAWEYTPSLPRVTDNALLLRWNERTLAAGEELRFVVDHGYVASLDARLDCLADELRVSDDSMRYEPQPLLVSATLRNTGTLPLPAPRVRFDAVAPCRLAAGESNEKALGAALAPGAVARFDWLVDVDAVDTATTVDLHFTLLHPDTLERDCIARLDVPPLRRAMVELRCMDTIRLHPQGGAQGYDPDPLAISALLSNGGQRALAGLTATIQLGAGVVLLGPATSITVQPEPLRAGARTTVLWLCRGISRETDQWVPYTIRVFEQGRQLAQCDGVVFLPGIQGTPCTETRVTTAGTDFPLAFLPDEVGSFSMDLRLYISAPTAARVTVTDARGVTLATADIPGAGLHLLQLPPSFADIDPESVRSNGVRVQSDVPIHLLAGNFRDRHSDAMTILPRHALGTRYVTVGYNWQNPWEHILVLATQPDTRVTINPKAMTSTGRPDGVPFDVLLNEGEVYYIKSFIAGDGGSLTGSIIDADKPIAVFSGGESGWIPTGFPDTYGYLNPHADQLPPVEHLGKDYILVPFRSRQRGDTWRIVATQPNTTAMIDGQARALPRAGDWLEGTLTDVTRITADNPLLVAQFANSARWDSDTGEYGDGSMLYCVPLDRHMRCHYFPAGMLVADAALETNTVAELSMGAALDFDNDPSLDVDSYTVEAWVQNHSSGPVLRRGLPTPGNNGWLLRYEALRNRFVLVVAGAAGKTEFAGADNSVSTRQWAHVALRVNAANLSIDVLVDGIRRISAGMVQAGAFVHTPLSIGGSYDGEDWTGLVDEIRLWAAQRGDAEVLSLKDTRVPNAGRTGLLGYWTFCSAYEDETDVDNPLRPTSSSRLVNSWDLPMGLRCAEPVDSSFVTITAPEDATSAVLLNHGSIPASEWRAVAGAPYRVATLRVPTGMNRLESTDARGVGAQSYGFAYHDAYTAFTGYAVSPLVAGSTAPALPADLHLGAVYPNPADGQVATVTMTLRAPASVRFVLVDAAGRLVRTLHDGDLPEGRSDISLPTGDLAAGSYRVLVLTESGQASTTFVVVR